METESSELKLKRCTKCKKDKLIAGFHKNKNTKDGLAHQCKLCAKEYAAKPAVKDRAKWTRIKRMYGLTKNQYELIDKYQENRCGICGRKSRRRELSIDHNHRTLEVRGLLCDMCNGFIGYYRDDIAIFERFVEYLTENLATKALGNTHKLTKDQHAKLNNRGWFPKPKWRRE